jgi:hypothetical protein
MGHFHQRDWSCMQNPIKAIYIVIVLTTFLLTALPLRTEATQTQSYQGQIVMERYFEAPGYGESADDQSAMRPLLYFDQTQSIDGEIDKITGSTIKLDAVQILSTQNKIPEGCVRVQGSLIPAETARHHTPWVLDSKVITASTGCKVIAQVNQCDAKKPTSFVQFWRSFRTAAIAADCTKLAQFASKNFHTKGSLDSDAIIELKAAQIAKQCPAWLDAEDAIDAQSSSLAIFFRRNATAPIHWRNGSDAQARVGPLLFTQKNGCWRWIRYYRTN